MNFEVIVRYFGDLTNLQNELGVRVELLGFNYAIITVQNESQIDQLLNYPQIVYVERPFILGPGQNIPSFFSSGIVNFKNQTGLTGNGVILGIIDSGIDYNLPIFKNPDGTSKILYYWDQSSTQGSPPPGFTNGTLYTQEDINKAINREINIPVSLTAAHGTHVAGIAARIANESNLIVVRVGSIQTDVFSRSTEFMRAIKFVIDASIEKNMPVAINMSYGTNEGSHLGVSLFEQYIDDMSLMWKNNMIVSAGNNANKGQHKFIQLVPNQNQQVEFVVGENEKILNLNIWPNFADDIAISITTPTNNTTPELSLNSRLLRTTLNRTNITGVFYPIPPYTLLRRVTIQLSSNTSIQPGIWRINFRPTTIVAGGINIYLPTSEGLSPDTRFLNPTVKLTVTVPGTANRVITVGSYNDATSAISPFSGQGDASQGVLKPDIVAPGEEILSYLPGGNQGVLSGTSMASPHVTASAALLMQWGIVNNNDPYMYGDRLKAILLKFANRNGQNIAYPNDVYGYGRLDLDNIPLESGAMVMNIDEKDGFNKADEFKYYGKIEKKNPTIRYTARESSGFFFSYSGDVISQLDTIGMPYTFIPLGVNTALVYFDEFVRTEQLLRLRNIDDLVRSLPMVLLGERQESIQGGVTATQEIGAKFFQTTPYVPLTGRGVLIGLIDTGIDYLHPDFRYEDGTSKIRYIWNQEQNIEGKNPERFPFGTEYNNQEINQAIANNNPDLGMDTVGHGTLVGGIMAGRGVVNPDYIGIAPDAELIVVKLRPYMDYDYDSTDVLAGMYYCYDKAYELNMPLILNISLGSNFGGANGTTIFENLGLYEEQGVITVAAAGNEGNTQTHYSGNMENQGEIRDVIVEVAQGEKDMRIEVWVKRPDKVSLSIISPSGDVSKELPVRNFLRIEGLFNLENTRYAITYYYPEANSGDEFVGIVLYDVKPGIWTLRLKGEYIIAGQYDIYLPNRSVLQPGTKFAEPDPFGTITFPATSAEFITVGTYNSINNSIWQSSSRGPTRYEQLKPDIVAPGVNIISTSPGGGYSTLTGSSAAGAHVSGAAALFLQYLLVENVDPYRAFIQMIKTFFMAGARTSPEITFPNLSYGYGILDLIKTFEKYR